MKILMFGLALFVMGASNANAKIVKSDDEKMIAAKRYAMPIILDLLNLKNKDDFVIKITKYKSEFTSEGCQNYISHLKNFEFYERVFEQDYGGIEAFFRRARLRHDDLDSLVAKYKLDEDDDEINSRLIVSIPLKVKEYTRTKPKTYRHSVGVEIDFDEYQNPKIYDWFTSSAPVGFGKSIKDAESRGKHKNIEDVYCEKMKPQENLDAKLEEK